MTRRGYQPYAPTPGDVATPRKIMRMLRARRRAADIIQREVARRIGCCQSNLAKAEAGIDDDQRLGFLRRYAEIVGLELQIGFQKKAEE
jgi:transcriptional regulator with XRE-family HTH domain